MERKESSQSNKQTDKQTNRQTNWWSIEGMQVLAYLDALY